MKLKLSHSQYHSLFLNKIFFYWAHKNYIFLIGLFFGFNIFLGRQRIFFNSLTFSQITFIKIFNTSSVFLFIFLSFNGYKKITKSLYKFSSKKDPIDIFKNVAKFFANTITSSIRQDDFFNCIGSAQTGFFKLLHFFDMLFHIRHFDIFSKIYLQFLKNDTTITNLKLFKLCCKN